MPVSVQVKSKSTLNLCESVANLNLCESSLAVVNLNGCLLAWFVNIIMLLGIRLDVDYTLASVPRG